MQAAGIRSGAPRIGRGMPGMPGSGRLGRTVAGRGRKTFHGNAMTGRIRPTALPASDAIKPSSANAHHGGGLRDRLGHAATMAVSSATQYGTDQSDIADSMGHTSLEMVTRAGMAASVVGLHAVGNAAGKARGIMTGPRRTMVAAYKAEKKAERKAAKQLKKAARKGKPGAAKAKRVAAAKKRAGKPTVLTDAAPSARIGKFAAKGKASRLIGKHVGGGLLKAGRGVKRLGSTGLGWMDEASAKLTAGDDDFASQLGNSARDLTFKATRKTAKGVTSSARFIWRHRRAPVKAAHGVKVAGRNGARGARAAAQSVRDVVSRGAPGVASVSLPVVPIIAAMLAVLGVLMAVMGAFMASSASASVGVKGVPAEYESDVIRAGSICSLITPPVIAAQIEAESDWNPDSVSPVGATGIAQFMPGTWASSGMDGDGDGVADIHNPHDQIWSQGNYMCSLAGEVESLKAAGRISGDSLQLTIAAYNAGLGNVMTYGGIPPFTETQNYVQRILGLIAKYTDSTGAGGGTVGSIADKPLIMQSDNFHVDLAAMGIPATNTHYQVFQCTWWADLRRRMIGRPLDPPMGNGGDWNDSAIAKGISVDRNPAPGDAMVFEPGVHGSSARYGHVAVVEAVNPDGSILISQSGRGWMAVVVETLSAGELASLGNGISFVH